MCSPSRSRAAYKHFREAMLLRRKWIFLLVLAALAVPGVLAHAKDAVAPPCIREGMYAWQEDWAVSIAHETFLIEGRCPGVKGPTREHHRFKILDVVDKVPALGVPTKGTPMQGRKHSRKLVIHFERSSSFLAKSERRRIREFARELGRGSRVKVIGYSSRTGTDSYNLWLSRRRAERVQEQMEIYGIHCVAVRGKGKCCPVDERRLAPNRRVEIYAVEGGGAY